MLASDLPIWFIRTFAFAFGALWGSFANVVIYRWPRELSVVSPGSHCVACDKPVRAYDNVPIFAWLWLRGRCRDCGARFSVRYPVIELLFAVISTAIAERLFAFHGDDLSVNVALAHYAVRFTVAFALLVSTFIDLDEMVVPWFVKWFAAVPLLGAWLLPEVAPTVGLASALAGAGIGYLGLRIVVIDGWKLLTGKRGMGIGDAEILLVIGALLGPAGVLFSLGAGAVQGVIATGIAIATRSRLGPAYADDVDDVDDDDDCDESANQEIAARTAEPAPAKASEPSPTDTTAVAPRRIPVRLPFVPFLALAGLEYLLGADALVDLYMRWLRGE